MLIIFDLDGTLLNTIDDLGYACNHALALAGFPTHPIDQYPALVGNGINALIMRALPAEERTETNMLRVREFFVPYYDAHNCDYTRPYDGIPALLETLKAQGHILAVASNKYQEAATRIVNRFFPHTFDLILGEREGVPRKPDPQIVNDLRSQAGQSLPVIYVGDSLVDRDTARNANVPFIACSWGFVSRDRLVGEKIEYIADSPEDIALHLYIETTILPQYDSFDGGHRRDHAYAVINESISLARTHNADERMAYVIAAYHDLGLRFDRETHHIHSAQILLEDTALRQWFTQDQLHLMSEAIEDHRASSSHPPRSIYGAIVAEADRLIDPITVIHRTMAYSLKLLPDADFETLYLRSKEHLHEKYAEGGYMRLWLNSRRNIEGLTALRAIIKDEAQLHDICLQWYHEQTSAH